MLGLLIADDDARSRARLANLLLESGYDVLTTDSAAQVLEVILKKVARVLIIGRQVGGLSTADLLPVLNKCKSDLKVILVSEDVSLPVMRCLRRDGIFYHLLTSQEDEDQDELQQVVECAFRKLGVDQDIAEGERRASVREPQREGRRP